MERDSRIRPANPDASAQNKRLPAEKITFYRAQVRSARPSTVGWQRANPCSPLLDCRVEARRRLRLNVSSNRVSCLFYRLCLLLSEVVAGPARFDPVLFQGFPEKNTVIISR